MKKRNDWCDEPPGVRGPHNGRRYLDSVDLHVSARFTLKFVRRAAALRDSHHGTDVSFGAVSRSSAPAPWANAFHDTCGQRRAFLARCSDALLPTLRSAVSGLLAGWRLLACEVCWHGHASPRVVRSQTEFLSSLNGPVQEEAV